MKGIALGLALILCAHAVAAEWVRTGLELHPAVDPPEPAVDRDRVAAQQDKRCAASSIRFGDTAAMRGIATADWDDTARTLAAIAALADSAQSAQSALAGIAPDDPAAQEIRDSQSILTALQFAAAPAAEQAAEQAAEPGTAPAALEDATGAATSDRLFWQALSQSKSATPAQWRDEIQPMLEAAFAADPSSFQVRAWRVIAWLQARPSARSDCAAGIAEFSDRLLDLSEASACPLMLGHVTHAIDRALTSRPETDTDRSRAAWRSFGEALLALVAGAPDVTRYRRSELANAPLACAGPMGAELDALMADPPSAAIKQERQP
ncbi:MAG: hypothetical protein AAGF79_06095 [Pseudomonadota bacterium]